MSFFKKTMALLMTMTLLTLLVACGTTAEPAKSTTAAAKTEAKKTEAAKTEAAKTDAKKTEAAKTEAKKTEAPKSDKAGQINVYTRDASSGTREGFEKVVDFKDKLTDRANEVSSNGDMATKVGQDVLGIGYVSLTTDFAANNITPVPYEGVKPTIENTLNGTYKMARPFSFVARAKGDFGSAEKEALVAAFVDFLTNSKEGRETVMAAGGIVDVKGGKAWDELKKNHPIVEKDNSKIEIVTTGSTSVEKSLKAALETFKGMAGNFSFKMNQTGSSDGFKRVLGSEKDSPNKGDLGFASRKFSDKEDVKAGMASGEYCLDAIVAVVNKANTKNTNFTKDVLFSIFTGEFKSWDQVK